MSNTEKTVLSRDVWWWVPPMPGQSDEDLIWGYRIEYSDGSHSYDFESKPSEEEIKNRTRCRFLDPGLSISL